MALQNVTTFNRQVSWAGRHSSPAGERLLNQEFLDLCLLSDKILSQNMKEMFGRKPFFGCRELRTVKIPIYWVLFELMERVPPECSRASVVERIRDLPRLKLLKRLCTNFLISGCKKKVMSQTVHPEPELSNNRSLLQITVNIKCEPLWARV